VSSAGEDTPVAKRRVLALMAATHLRKRHQAASVMRCRLAGLLPEADLVIS
jgi:hypothetical protein